MASTTEELATWTGSGLSLRCEGDSQVRANGVCEPAQPCRALPSYMKVIGFGPGI